MTENSAEQIMLRITRLEIKKELEPVTAIHHGGQKQFMERIKGTTKYLSSARKIIYDVTFLTLYNHDLKIPEGCIALENMLLKIEGWAHIDHIDSFLKILDRPPVAGVGTRIYLDHELFMDNVPFIKSDAIRDELLTQRNDGTRWFDVLRVIDPSGNETQFLPSRKAIRLHEASKKAV
jgi:hypothetical protein